MSTVINLNLLNFHRPAPEIRTSDDLNASLAEQRQQQRGEEGRIIDVTSYSRITTEKLEQEISDRGKVRDAARIVPYSSPELTYDHRGRMVVLSNHKGQYVDSYA